MNLDMIDSPVFILDALSDNYLFFNECDIAWDGQCHTFEGIQVNASKADELERIACGIWDYDDIREFVLYFQNFLLQLESDDQIKVPRSMVAPGIRRALPEGDLTGITLANLAACAGAIRFEKTTAADLLEGTDGEKYANVEAYTVFYDVRLANGIPCFFDLVARMLWDLRQCFRSLDGRGFAIAFFAVRNLDADQYFGDVDSPVAGAQENPLLMVVDSAPEISLIASSSGSIEARVDGALDVEKPGCDMANDVELFETLSAAERNIESNFKKNATGNNVPSIEKSETGSQTSEKQSRVIETSDSIDVEAARQRGFTVIHEWTQMLAKYIESKESEEKRLYSELSNLGIFEFGAKKAKRAEIDEVAASIYRWSKLPDAWERVADWLRICDLANNYKNRERKFGKRVSEGDVESNVRFVLSRSLILFRMKDLGRPVTNEEIGEFLVELTGDNCYRRRSNMM